MAAVAADGTVSERREATPTELMRNNAGKVTSVSSSTDFLNWSSLMHHTEIEDPAAGEHDVAGAAGRLQAGFCQLSSVPPVFTALASAPSGSGYSASLRQKPFLAAKSRRGGQKMS